MVYLNAEALNQIVKALDGRQWKFTGAVRFNDFMMQCWIETGGMIYCCTRGAEWDAVAVASDTTTAGKWCGEITELLRRQVVP